MRKEKEINLVNLCFYVLSKWKILIIIALVGAFIMGAGSYLKSYSNYKNSQFNTENTNIEITLTEKEIEETDVKIAIIEEYKNLITEYDYYLENSIKLKLNPNKFYQGGLVYFFSAENVENIAKAKAICASEIFQESVYEEVSSLLSEKTDATLIKEIVNFSEQERIEDRTFSILVQHYDQEQCQIILDFFERKMESIGERLESKGIRVNIENISSGIKTCNDASLMKLRHVINTKKLEAFEKIEAIEAKMTNEQKEYYEFMSNKKDTENIVSATAIQNPEFSIKFIIVGALVAMFFAFCLYGVLYICSKQVHTKEELESWISLPVYNYEITPKEKNNVIDSCLNSMEKIFTGKKTDSPEMIAQMLVNVAKQANSEKIYFSGTVGSLDNEIVKKIKELIIEESIEVITGNSILCDAKSLQKAAECGNIVFMEKCNISKESDIYAEINKASTCEINILGIILEG